MRTASLTALAIAILSARGPIFTIPSSHSLPNCGAHDAILQTTPAACMDSMVRTRSRLTGIFRYLRILIEGNLDFDLVSHGVPTFSKRVSI